ncbi:unnamed protein product [Dracunculus medinensis]|uniref:CCR4-NOT transcription complex subunit 11 n=1 Tax=Dracunculus medinensis TaxID=318479 RepID=A0A0N4ULW6_DRAME|nr:unnamed protein product [Dracunculus medinensis]
MAICGHPTFCGTRMATYVQSLIGSSLNAEIRRKNWRELLKYYYSSVNDKLDGENKIDYDQLELSFIRLLPFQMILLLPTLGPMVLNPLKKTHPEEYELGRRTMIEKAVALIDDLLFYYELNKESVDTVVSLFLEIFVSVESNFYYRMDLNWTESSCGSNRKKSDDNFDTAIDYIYRLCTCNNKRLIDIGNAFIEKCHETNLSLVTLGSAILTGFRELIGHENITERIVLYFFLYRITDIENPIDRSKSLPKQLTEDALQHPYLAFFLYLFDFDIVGSNSSFHDFDQHFPHFTVASQEKMFISFLLTGHYNDVCHKTPSEIITHIVEYNDPRTNMLFDLSRHKASLRISQTMYPAMAKKIFPAIFPVADCSKSLSLFNIANVVSDFNKVLPNILTLPAPFLRISPTLMPPSDDEFQFLYPFLLEPLWIRDEKSNSVVAEQSDQFSISDSIQFDSLKEMVNNTEVESLAPELKQRLINSLPSTPELSTPNSCDEKIEKSTSSFSVCSLPNLFLASNSSIRYPSETDHINMEKKSLLNYEMAIELLKKALGTVIARTDAQKLADAIAADPTIADIVDIPFEKFPKFIDDNPTVAAAVIVGRITKNSNELPLFFELLIKMNVSVQAMEVVNKLCTQIDFPQDYLNRYISNCVQRCEDPNQSGFPQSRQVRMVCVFLSSLLRNRTWDVHPLSAELQSFGLKFSHVKEAASLYQEIIGAPQLNDANIANETTGIGNEQ